MATATSIGCSPSAAGRWRSGTPTASWSTTAATRSSNSSPSTCRNGSTSTKTASKIDDRSPDKGPEPEGLVVGRVGDSTYAFVGLERTSAMAVFDVTRPEAAKLLDVVPLALEKSKQDATGGPHIAPEGAVLRARRPQPARRAALGRGLRSHRHDAAVSRRFCFGRVNRGRMRRVMPPNLTTLIAVDIGNSRIKLGRFDRTASPRELPEPTATLELPLTSKPGDFDAAPLAAWCGRAGGRRRSLADSPACIAVRPRS